MTELEKVVFLAAVGVALVVMGCVFNIRVFFIKRFDGWMALAGVALIGYSVYMVMTL